MSLGLAVCRDNTMYLAIESEGLQSGVLQSKLIPLQQRPTLLLLVTGGLEHWRDVIGHYQSKATVHDARDELMRLLLMYTKIDNQACCLLCGFESGQPICYRINKLENQTLASYAAPPDTVQSIGISDHAAAATGYAENALAAGETPEQALRKAIESRIPGQGIRGPVETRVLRAA